ncbi:hypothetical protein ACA910_012220 [Epithemia clementina (nom. ined.)]
MALESASFDNNQRDILLQELAQLLGFDDGASDVLDHLLTIDSSEDLLDYLSQLLGSANDPVKQFVENICRFQRGESVVVVPVVAEQDGDRKPAAVPTYEPKVTSRSKSKTPPRQKQNAVVAPASSLQTLQHKSTSKNNKPLIAKTKAPQRQQQQQQQQQQPSKSKQSFSSKVKPNSVPQQSLQSPQPTPSESAPASTAKPAPKKSHPTRGTPKVVCECFGTFHKPLANCLFCGRISCEKEGYDYCPFCGYLVERVVGGGSDAASIHKERLLRFDREYAKRTVVLDDQADYFTQQSLNWVDKEQDRQRYLDLEQERLENTGKQAKMKLELNL